MPLSDEDVREILRIIDESDLSELRIDTDGFSLHVVKGDHRATTSTPPPRSAPRTAPEPEPEPEPAASGDGLTTIPAPMLGTFYRA